MTYLCLDAVACEGSRLIRPKGVLWMGGAYFKTRAPECAYYFFEVNLLRSRNPSRHTASWRARPTVDMPSAVRALSLNSCLSPYQVHNTKLCPLVTVCINTTQYYAQPSILVQARSTKCCARRSRYGKTCSFCMYSYIIVRIIPTVLILVSGTRYFVTGID